MNPTPKTPNIDVLASEDSRFTRGYIDVPVIPMSGFFAADDMAALARGPRR